MALASALIALISLPLDDTVGSPTTAIRIASGLAFAFTAVHVSLLIARTRAQPLPLDRTTWILASLIDLSIFLVAILALVTANEGPFEWLLVLLVSRPAIAFVLALRDVMNP